MFFLARTKKSKARVKQTRQDVKLSFRTQKFRFCSCIPYQSIPAILLDLDLNKNMQKHIILFNSIFDSTFKVVINRECHTSFFIKCWKFSCRFLLLFNTTRAPTRWVPRARKTKQRKKILTNKWVNCSCIVHTDFEIDTHKVEENTIS